MKNKVSQDYNFHEQFYIVRIRSQVHDYQLAWSLNSHLKVDFRKLPELMVFQPKKPEKLPHSLYRWTSSNAVDYFLITSLNEPIFLSAETFLLVEKREHKETVDRLVEKISSFDFIFSIEELFDTPTTTSKQRQFVEQLNNIAISMEEYFNALKTTFL
jgi:hypothetical protein